MTTPTNLKTFHYCNSLTQSVTLGKVAGRIVVTATTCPEHYPVGMANPERQLRACGWAPIRKRVERDVWGRRIG